MAKTIDDGETEIPVDPDAKPDDEVAVDDDLPQDAEGNKEVSVVPTVGWVGAFALLAVGIVATIATGGILAAVALAVGIVAVAVATAVELWNAVPSPVQAAGHALWSIWAALRYLVSGEPGKAWQTLKNVKVSEWLWLLVLVLAVAVALWWWLFKRKRR